MANQYGIDLGSAFLRGEQIQKAQEERKFAEHKNEIAGLTAPLRNQFASGETPEARESAFRQLSALDPESAKAINDALSQADDRNRKLMNDRAEQTGRFSYYALQRLSEGNSPEAKAQIWGTLKANAPQGVGEKMPDQVDENFFRQGVMVSMSVKELTEAPTTVNVGGRTDVYNSIGQKTDSAKSWQAVNMENSNQQRSIDRQSAEKNSLIRSNGGGIGKVPAALRMSIKDVTELRKQSENAVGGILVIDPGTGQKAIHKGRADQANWIATRAEHYMRKDGTPMFQAVNKAKRDMRAALEREGKSGNRNPGADNRPSAKGIF